MLALIKAYYLKQIFLVTKWLASLASDHRLLTSVWVYLPRVIMLKTCPNTTLAAAVERYIVAKWTAY